jgi:Holliday junction resolvasome RuvABC endonuclease subunit
VIYIGIDPGGSGGLAAIDGSGDLIRAIRMPEVESEILEFLRDMRTGNATAVASLEFVRAMPKQGVTSVFTFGRNYGGLRMALAATGIPFDEPVPRKWQAALSCLSGGDKNVTKRRACELFGARVKVTHAIADALLLAEYTRRTWDPHANAKVPQPF